MKEKEKRVMLPFGADSREELREIAFFERSTMRAVLERLISDAVALNRAERQKEAA